MEEIAQSAEYGLQDFHLIPAHKIILTAISGYFGKLFRLQVNSKETLICLQSVNYLELTQIIKYIYHGEVEVPEDNLDKFLGLAERFNLKGLMQVNSKNALLDRAGLGVYVLRASQARVYRREPER